MADYAKVNDVTAANLSKVNNVAKAAISKVNNCTKPSAGATLWCIVGDDGAVATAAASNLNAWTGYFSAGLDDDSGSSKPYEHVAYGKDPSDGSTVWVGTAEDNNREIRYSADPTAGVDAWTDVDDPMAKIMHGACWGNDVWIACGANGKMFRCVVDMDTWVEVDLTGITGYSTARIIQEVTSDGAGKWICGQDSRIYTSANDGATWTLAVDIGDHAEADSNYDIHTVAYTDSKWIVFCRRSGNSRVFYAAGGADLTNISNWNGATVSSSAQAGTDLVSSGARRMAAGGGTVIIAVGNDTSRSTNGGVDWTKNANDLPHADCYDIATDGQGNWVAVHNSGRVSISTDDGGSWAEQSGVQDGGSDLRLRFPPGSGNPIADLDSVAANVLLPV